MRNNFCQRHIDWLGPGAECPVCTTGAQVMRLSRSVVELANRLEQIHREHGFQSADITLEINCQQIVEARMLVEP